MLDLLENQLTVSLLVTTLFAGLLTYARNVPSKISGWMWRQFSVTVEVPNSDQAFNWMTVWLDRQPYSKTARSLVAETTADDDEIIYNECGTRKKRIRPKVLFSPAPGEHLLWYKGKMIWISRNKKENAQHPHSVLRIESIHISVIGRRQEIIREIINDAMLAALPDEEPETLVVPSADGRWMGAIRRKPRAKSSVILANDAMDLLISDARTFLTNQAWYEALGVPYRRGYLLHGVPGSGKTSAVLAIAGELNLDVYVLNLGDRLIDDGRLNGLLAQVPTGQIVLLEDIDGALANKQTTKRRTPESTDTPISEADEALREMASGNGVTFSGLLNALDGVVAREGRILFMTTNHKEILDPALIRPGRADLHVSFGHATPQQAANMFMRFFPSAPENLALEFAQCANSTELSMAAIQDFLLVHRKSAEEAANNWASVAQNRPAEARQ